MNNSVLTYQCYGAVTISYNSSIPSIVVSDSCCFGGFSNSPVTFQNSDSTFIDGWGGGSTKGKIYPGDSISCYQKQGSGPYNYYQGHKIYSLPTTISELDNDAYLEVYPNPVKNRTIHVLTSLYINYFELYDLLGKRFPLQLHLNSDGYDLKLPDGLTPGIYFLNTEKDGTIISEKIIISE